MPYDLFSNGAILMNNEGEYTMKKVNDLRGQAAVSRTAGAESLSPGNWLRAWHNSRDKGQSLVEFAIVLPILLAVMLVIFEVGIFLLNYQTLTQAVNQGGMTLQQIVGMSGASDPCAAVATAVIGSAGNLQTAGANGIQLQISIGSYTSSTGAASGFSCGGGSSYVIQGATASVTGTYPCSSFAVSYFDHQPFKFFASGCTMKATTQEYMQ
jgi:Flp pilus assembly protein TadG